MQECATIHVFCRELPLGLERGSACNGCLSTLVGNHVPEVSGSKRRSCKLSSQWVFHLTVVIHKPVYTTSFGAAAIMISEIWNI